MKRTRYTWMTFSVVGRRTNRGLSDHKPGGKRVLYRELAWKRAGGGAHPSQLRPSLLFRSMRCVEISLSIHGRRFKRLTMTSSMSYRCNGCTVHDTGRRNSGSRCPDLCCCAGSWASWAAAVLPSTSTPGTRCAAVYTQLLCHATDDNTLSTS